MKNIDIDVSDRFINWHELKRIVPYSRSRLYVLEAKGLFPKRRKLGLKSVAWLESEVTEWMRSRKAA